MENTICIAFGYSFLFTYFGHGNYYAALFLVPFTFNFGVMPMVLPQDWRLEIPFWAHHMAPVVWICLKEPGDSICSCLLFHAWFTYYINR
eukprot:UN01092